MRSFIAVAYILGCSSAALAQQLTIQVNGVPQISVGPNDCGMVPSVSWTLTGVSTVCSGPTFWITSTTCGDAPAGSDITLTPLPQTSDRQGTFNSPGVPAVRDFPGFNQADGGVACGGRVNETHFVCGSVKYTTFACGQNDTTLRASAPGRIDYRGKPPDPPQTPTLIPQDSALTVQWGNPPADAVYIHVFLRVAGSGTDFSDVARPQASDNGVKIGNLQNGTTYEVYLTAEDSAGNQSDRSGSAQETPVASDGFFGTYRKLGGQEQGGCGGAIPGVVGVPLALGGYQLLRRRRCRRDS